MAAAKFNDFIIIIIIMVHGHGMSDIMLLCKID